MLSRRAGRRGFTLVELTAVIAILAVTATLVAPRLITLRETAETRTTLNRLVANVGTARNLARSRAQDLVVGLDGDARSVSIESVPSATPPPVSANAAGTSPATEDFSQNLSVGTRFTLGTVDRGDNPPADAPQARTGETLGVFYADGTASPATVEITVNGRRQSLRVRTDGSVTLSTTNDDADPNEPVRWKAGDLEVRTG